MQELWQSIDLGDSVLLSTLLYTRGWRPQTGSRSRRSLPRHVEGVRNPVSRDGTTRDWHDHIDARLMQKTVASMFEHDIKSYCALSRLR